MTVQNFEPTGAREAVLITSVAAGPAVSDGAAAELPGEWIQPRTGCARRGTALYLHGGAYCVGGPAPTG